MRIKPLHLHKEPHKYLAAAIAASATCIVTYDKDLLTLGKPFGIEIIRPPEFLRRLAAE